MAEIGKKGQKLENLLKIRWKLANFWKYWLKNGEVGKLVKKGKIGKKLKIGLKMGNLV